MRKVVRRRGMGVADEAWREMMARWRGVVKLGCSFSGYIKYRRPRTRRRRRRRRCVMMTYMNMPYHGDCLLESSSSGSWQQQQVSGRNLGAARHRSVVVLRLEVRGQKIIETIRGVVVLQALPCASRGMLPRAMNMPSEQLSSQQQRVEGAKSSEQRAMCKQERHRRPRTGLYI